MAEGVGVARLGATAGGWIRFLVGTKKERISHGAEILLVGWEAVDAWLLVIGAGPLRGGFGFWDVWGMVLVWLLDFGSVKREVALHRCSEWGIGPSAGPSTGSGQALRQAFK